MFSSRQSFYVLGSAGLCFVGLCLLFAVGTSPGLSEGSHPQAVSARETQDYLLQQAQQLIEQKDYSRAARIFQRLLRKNPRSFPALNGLGVVQTQMGDYAQAARAYEKALVIKPNSFPLLLNLGICYFKAEKYTSASHYLKLAVSDQPANFQARSLLAMSYYADKRFKSASGEFQKLLAAKPGNQTLQYLLAESYLRGGSYNEFLAYFQSILQRSPNSAALHMLMGEAYDGLDRTSEAIKQFQIAASLAPHQPDVHFGLGYLYWKKHEYEKASVQFQREIQAKGSVAKSKAYLGDIAMREGKKSRAHALLKAALHLYPRIRLAYYDLGILDMLQKKYDQAIVNLENAIKMEPNRADAHYRLAEVYRVLGRKQLAQKELDIVSRIHTKKRDTLLHEISGPAHAASAHQ